MQTLPESLLHGAIGAQYTIACVTLRLLNPEP